jgi:hypothetical protein
MAACRTGSDCGGAPLGFGNFWSCGGGLIAVYGRKAFSFASGFLREREGVKESLKRLSEAPLPLVGPELAELAHPKIEVDLKVIDRGIDLLAEATR